MKNKRKFSLIDKIFAVLAFFSILIFVFHYFILPVQASSATNYTLPVPPEYQCEFISAENLIALLKTAETSYGGGWSNKDYFVQFSDFTKNGYNQLLVRVQITVIPDTYNSFSDSINDSNYSTFDFVNYPNGITCNFTERYRYNLNISTNTPMNRVSNPINALPIKFGQSPTTTFLGTYTVGSICYSTKDIFVSSSSSNKVIGLPQSNERPIGHATEPDTSGNNITTGGLAEFRNQPSLPPFNPPVIDTSTIEKLLESIFDILEYIPQYIGELFSTFFAWLVDIIKNAIQAVINNIKNLIDNLYDNFVSLFEPISENISYLVEPISATIIYDNIGETSLVSNIGIIETSIDSFTSSFNSLSEPDTYTIPIHLENLPTSYFGTLSTQYIDLGVINPVKNIIRVFVWALTTYGLFITIVDSISNYINGGQDE